MRRDEQRIFPSLPRPKLSLSFAKLQRRSYARMPLEENPGLVTFKEVVVPSHVDNSLLESQSDQTETQVENQTQNLETSTKTQSQEKTAIHINIKQDENADNTVVNSEPHASEQASTQLPATAETSLVNVIVDSATTKMGNYSESLPLVDHEKRPAQTSGQQELAVGDKSLDRDDGAGDQFGGFRRRLRWPKSASAGALAFMAAGAVLLAVIGVLEYQRGHRDSSGTSSGLNSGLPASDSVAFSNLKRSCLVYCSGDILEAVQRSSLFIDSKEFVDMPMKKDPEEILALFQKLPDKKKPSELQKFVVENFYPAGTDIVPYTLPDFSLEPKLLHRIADPKLRDWAHHINLLWKVLGRKADIKDQARHSLIKTTHPLVVPGGRFRESYYWDSLWIIKGLLACDMLESAKGVVENLLSFVRDFGFVPNGGRVYYLNRSQPPMLSEMVKEIYNYTGDVSYIKEALPTLEKEYLFWMTARNGHIVTVNAIITDPASGQITNKTWNLNRFFANTTLPRPESYSVDVKTSAGMSTAEAQTFFREISAAAETGWDFSSRWLSNPPDLSSIHTSDIIPVDLNSVMYRMEMNLAYLHREIARNESRMLKDDIIDVAELDDAEAEVGEDKELKVSSNPERTAALVRRRYAVDLTEFDTGMERAAFFDRAANSRFDAIWTLLWNSTDNQWKDYHMSSQRHSDIVAASNYLPLWAGVADKIDDARQKAIVDSFTKSELLQVAGIRATIYDTKQQWDSPNAWPPLQHMLIEGFQRCCGEQGLSLSKQVMRRWIGTAYSAWNSTGYMYEKYNALEYGKGGSGGEYTPQLGFGWTNGAVLDLLKKYGTDLIADYRTK